VKCLGTSRKWLTLAEGISPEQDGVRNVEVNLDTCQRLVDRRLGTEGCSSGKKQEPRWGVFLCA
jgi:hypothetical protein